MHDTISHFADYFGMSYEEALDLFVSRFKEDIENSFDAFDRLNSDLEDRGFTPITMDDLPSVLANS